MEYLLFLQELRESAGDFINNFLLYFSDFMGSAYGMLIPALIYWCIDKGAGTYIGLSFTGSVMVNQTLKNIACVYRPWILDSRIVPVEKALPEATGYSFPSGHTTIASSIYGGIAVLQRKRKLIAGLCIAAVLLTAFSRNWLGVHTPQDVLAALAISCLILGLSSLLLKYIEKHPEKDILIAVAGCVVSALVLVWLAVKSYPIDYNPDGSILVDPYEMATDCYRATGSMVGFFVGWVLERRFIKFKMPEGFWKGFVRIVIGFAAALLLYGIVLPAIFDPLGTHFGKLLKYFFIMLFVTAGYPALFTAFDKLIAKKKK